MQQCSYQNDHLLNLNTDHTWDVSRGEHPTNIVISELAAGRFVVQCYNQCTIQTPSISQNEVGTLSLNMKVKSLTTVFKVKKKYLKWKEILANCDNLSQHINRHIVSAFSLVNTHNKVW